MKLRMFAVALSGLIACGDDGSSSGSGGSSTGGGGSGAGSETGGQSTGGQATGGQTTGGQAQGGAGTGGAEACITPELVFEEREGNAEACLTYSSASELCDSGVERTICEMAVACQLSSDVDQCGINCAMGSTEYCSSEAQTRCVIDAFCANDCDALAACGFIL